MIAIALLLAVMTGDEAALTEARRLYEAGGQAYEQGRYVLAIEAFEGSMQRAPRPITAFSAAQAYRLQYFIDGDPRRLERAIELYQAYLELAPTGNRREHAAQHLATLKPILERIRRDQATAPQPRAPEPQKTRIIVSSRTPDAQVRIDGGDLQLAPASFEVTPGKHRVEVEAPEHLPQVVETVAVPGTTVALPVALDPRPGALRIRAPDGARVTVDGRLVGSTPIAQPISLRPGRHVVAVTDRGKRPFLRELEVARGQALELDARLEPTTQRWIAYGLFAGGGALLAGGTAAWLAALGKEGEAESLEDKLGSGMPLLPAEAQRYRTLEAERDDLVRLGTVTALLGLAAGATGVVLWLTDQPEPPAAVITPVVTPGGGGAAVQGEF